MRENLEYWLVVAVARTLGRMPRGLARLLAGCLPSRVYWALGRLRRVGVRNLELALPELSAERAERFCAASIVIWAGNWWSFAA